MLTDNTQMFERDDFGADLDDQAILEASKFDVNQVTLKISKVVEMSELNIQKLFEIFNQYKFVILECNPLPNPKENLLALEKIFGSIKKSKRSEVDGIIPVENLHNSSLAKTNVSTTNTIHLMHTDGSAEIDPPKIVALQCEIPSHNGGLSQIICAESIYEYLRKNHFQELQVLFINPLTVTRVEQTASRPIFVEQEGKISITFRTIRKDHVSIEIPSQIKKVYNIINNYVNNPKNQLIFKLKAHQILILDNTGVLHGRTSFPENEFRKLNKLWFDGISEYSHRLQLGFMSKFK